MHDNFLAEAFPIKPSDNPEVIGRRPRSCERLVNRVIVEVL